MNDLQTKRQAVVSVLLVEDNEDDYILVRDLCSDIATPQFDLHWVETCDAARECLARRSYDVCLLDYRLREETGVELLREFVRGKTPFILLTGSEDYQVDVAATLAGASDYLVKGHINSPLLERSIRYAIQHKASELALLQSQRFAQATVDALPDNIAVLDKDGVIVAVNSAWRSFAQANGFIGVNSGVGTNYLSVCDSSKNREAQIVATGIRAVISGKQEQFRLEYLCHSPQQKRWVEMRVTRFTGIGPLHVVVAHEDITNRKQAEAQSDRFFSLSLEMLGIAGIDGYFKRVNPAFVDILGFAESEFVAPPFVEFVHPEDRAATEAAVAALSHGKAVAGFENRYRTKDGVWRWLEWKSTSVPEEGLIYAAARDITERKESEAALHRMRGELELRVQERTKELERANAEIQIGAHQQEIVAEFGRRALLDIDLEILLQDAANLVATTLEVELSALLEWLPDSKMLRVRASSGWETYLKGYQIPFSGDSQSGIPLLLSTSTVVINSPSEISLMSSPFLQERGIISGIRVSVGGPEQPFGILVAYTVQDRHFSPDDVHFMESLSHILVAAIDQRRVTAEICEVNAQLTETNEQLRIEIIQRQTILSAFQELMVGLEQAKGEAEQAKERAEIASRAKSEFLSRMSHELRTPLNAILGFGQLLEVSSGEADPRQKRNVQQILRAGHHLLDLINEVLDIARIEAGHLLLSPEPVAVGLLVQEALEVISPLAEPRQIQLINLIKEEDYSRQVLADQQRLKQVLFNYLSNAVKYNHDSGRVMISCSVIDDMERDVVTDNPVIAPGDPILVDSGQPMRRLRILVQDTGPGITEQDLIHLFIPFERLGATRTSIEGTGLGLSLCKQLIEAMHGQVGVESKPGRGSTFWLELPLVQDPLVQDLPHSDQVLSLGQRSVFGTPTSENSRIILYIEDNLSNITLVEQLLSDLIPSARLLTAMQGRLGVEFADQHRPDLILLDIHLPDIQGDVVLSHLKSNPRTREIPVVMLSADATPRQIDRMLNAGAIDYLAKPLDVTRFVSVLKKILNLHSDNQRPTPVISGIRPGMGNIEPL